MFAPEGFLVYVVFFIFLLIKPGKVSRSCSAVCSAKMEVADKTLFPIFLSKGNCSGSPLEGPALGEAGGAEPSPLLRAHPRLRKHLRVEKGRRSAGKFILRSVMKGSAAARLR